MLDLRKYYKMIGAAVFAALVASGVNTTYSNILGTTKIIAKQDIEDSFLLNIDTLTLTDVLYNSMSEKVVEAKEPTVIEYTVKANDTLESIANAYSIKQSTITASNSLTENTALSEGQKLTFPSIDGVIYKIKGGETLWDLSNLYKLSTDEIITVNKLENPDKLALGQALIMPNAGSLLTLETKSSSNKSSSSSSKAMVAINRGAKPTNGSISSKFGERWGKEHKGVDIAAATGTDVYAYNSGTVTFSGWQDGYGNVIIINHGNGLETYYGHNSKLLVRAGQTVSKGQHISEVGSTGRSTGPHLHFEVRKNGVPVNPLPYLK